MTDPRTMRRGPRLGLRWLIFGVLAAGLGFGLLARRLDRQARQERAIATMQVQYQVARETIAGPVVALWKGTEVSASGTQTMLGGEVWRVDFMAETHGPGPETISLLRVILVGSLEGVDPAPIRIIDRGGLHRAEALRLLSEAFAREGWRTEVVEAVPEEPASTP